MEPLVSICLPVYNTSLYLKQCLESLYNQTIADKCEFIIVNDCSTANSLEVINKVTSRYNNLSIKIISHNYNKGVAGARNTALEVATGKYCLHLDSDDWCELNYAETLANLAEKENADIVTSFFDFTPPESYDYVKGLLNHEFPVTSWTRLIRRDLFLKNNIKWVEGINVGEDPIISCKLFYFANKVVATPVKLYHYRENRDVS
ncbi:glycosyltransferase family 2 protein [Treponema rectale]|uniref:Glycosyltransferase family 2 protein n=1 Tax=Treponema rectale TaxID=744512 RepID=A0A840SG52_9SPIR|nr:glycosyltransferase family 2 protein [Treponema rectale]MBB5218412.1 glycosyltransferase involved in cell wall biosynthesis [Treponema rectale]QOS39896.1 glycosyltransferase family 2 protein [Treponema rectale]